MRSTSSRTKSCSRCRSLKARCDRERRYPRRCTRCVKRKLPCDSSDLLRDTPPVQSDGFNSITTTVYHERPQEETAHGSGVVSINQHSFTSDEVQHLFDLFFTHLHPHFPVLDPTLDHENCLAHSPVLFWTIIIITSKIVNRKRYEELQPSVRALVGDIAATGYQSVAECQALCLLCVWPLDAVESRGSDNIHLYARMAHGIATERGLHRPGFQYEFQHTEDTRTGQAGTPEARNKTWCAVYLVDHHVSSRGGLPSSIREDFALKQMLGTVEPALAEQCRLAMIRSRYLDAVAFHGACQSGLTPPRQRLALLTMFKEEVISFMETLPETSVISLIVGHYTLVCIGGFCLAGDIPKELDVVAVPLVHEALASARAIPDLLSPLMWETLPMHVLRCLVYAAIYMVQCRRCRFSLIQDECDVDAFVDRALSMLLPLSFGRDYATRSRTVLQLYHKLAPIGFGNHDHTVLCQSRMGANIYWDLFHCEEGTHQWTVDREQIRSEIDAAVAAD